jgi:hypothetical protein
MIIENYLRKMYSAVCLADIAKYTPEDDESPESIIQHSLENIPENFSDDQKKLVDEFKGLIESTFGKEIEIDDKELDKLVDELSDEDILAEYDDEELVTVDEETGEEVDTSEVDSLTEGLSRVERLRARNRFKRTKAKRQMKARIALKRHSDRGTLNKRARRLAIKMLKKKFSKKALGDMTVADKERVERIIASRKALVNRLALKMVPRVKKLEKERLS